MESCVLNFFFLYLFQFWWLWFFRHDTKNLWNSQQTISPLAVIFQPKLHSVSGTKGYCIFMGCCSLMRLKLWSYVTNCSLKHSDDSFLITSGQWKKSRIYFLCFFTVTSSVFSSSCLQCPQCPATISLLVLFLPLRGWKTLTQTYT